MVFVFLETPLAFWSPVNGTHTASSTPAPRVLLSALAVFCCLASWKLKRFWVIDKNLACRNSAQKTFKRAETQCLPPNLMEIRVSTSIYLLPLQACCPTCPCLGHLCACGSIDRGAGFAGHAHWVTRHSLPLSLSQDASSLQDAGQGLKVP